MSNSSWFRKGTGGAKRTYGRQSKVSPKSCSICKKQGTVVDSVRYEGHIRRRYKCICEARWTTYEVTVSEEEIEKSEKEGWIPSEKREADHSKTGVSELEYLDRLVELGKGLWPEYFPTAELLVKIGYAEVKMEGETRFIIPTEEGKRIAEIRRLYKEE